MPYDALRWDASIAELQFQDDATSELWRTRAYAAMPHPVPVRVPDVVVRSGRAFLAHTDHAMTRSGSARFVSRRVLDALLADGDVRHVRHPVKLFTVQGEPWFEDVDAFDLIELNERQPDALFGNDVLGVPSGGLPSVFHTLNRWVVSREVSDRLAALRPAVQGVVWTALVEVPRPDLTRESGSPLRWRRAPSWIRDAPLDAADRELFDSVVANLDDDEPREVLADHLLERGAPFGRLMRFQLDRHRVCVEEPDWSDVRPTTEERGLATWADAWWLGHPRSDHRQWARGFPFDMHELASFERAVERRFTQTVRTLQLTRSHGDLEQRRGLVTHPHLAQVRTLVVDPADQIAPLLEAAPAVRAVRLVGPWPSEVDEVLRGRNLERCDVTLASGVEVADLARLDVRELRITRYAVLTLESLREILDTLPSCVRRVQLWDGLTACLPLVRKVPGWTLDSPAIESDDAFRRVPISVGWLAGSVRGGVVTIPDDLDARHFAYVVTGPRSSWVLATLPEAPVHLELGLVHVTDWPEVHASLPPTVRRVWVTPTFGFDKLLALPQLHEVGLGDPFGGLRLRLRRGPSGDYSHVALSPVGRDRDVLDGLPLERIRSVVPRGLDPHGWALLQTWCASRGLHLEGEVQGGPRGY